MLRISWYIATLILPALPNIATAADSRAVALVLDASGSMKEHLPDGVTRMDAAKHAVAKLVATLPGDTRLAFRAYGHQSPTKDKNCTDTALLSPFGSVKQVKDTIVAKVNALVPQGYTPISYVLQQAASDLTSEEATLHTVVLVSDGKETCSGDPCAVAKSLAEADAKLVIHTIGAGVDGATREQLTCIANAARGTYQDAANTAELEKVVAVAAETEAVEIATKPAAKSVEISAKKPSSAIGSPTQISVGEVVKGRISGGQDHFWRIEAPVGKYRLVFDAKNADDSDVGLIIGVKGSAGDTETSLVSLSDNQIKQRGVAEVAIPEGGLTLRVGDAKDIRDYWLSVTPLNATVASPYFYKTPVVTALEVGKSATAALTAGEPEGWFSTKLEAKDYKVTAEFMRTDKASSMSADLSMFGGIGEVTAGPTVLCSVTENASTATCTSKLVVAQEGPVTLRTSARWKGDYKVTFKLEPIED
jgi:von Willebrand factor type A domain